MPGPHRCYRAAQAVTFVPSDTKDFWGDLGKNWWNPSKWGDIGKPRIRLLVKSFSTVPQIVAFSPEAAKLNIGDEILTINDLSLADYIRKNKWFSGGANDAGALRSITNYISSRGGIRLPMPKESKTTYTVRSFNDPSRTFTVTLPWVAVVNDDCIASTKLVLAAIKAKETSRFEGPLSESGIPINLGRPLKKAKTTKENLLWMENPVMDEMKEDFALGADGAKIKIQRTEDPIVRWAIYEPEKRNMGIIFLDSFVPAGSDVPKVVLLVRSLLLNELKDTNSLVFDIRDNGGGVVTMADTIPQLVAAKVVPGNVRAIVDPINEFLLVNQSSATDAFNIAYRNTPKGQRYTSFAKFTTEEDANTLGQVYFKPVGVFNNGNCYSACDLFSANMQDTGIVPIFSEDVKSGAGGANVVQYSSFFSFLANQFFQVFIAI
jgi:hypothetical protein